jgi:hypothetical protein
VRLGYASSLHSRRLYFEETVCSVLIWQSRSHNNNAFRNKFTKVNCGLVVRVLGYRSGGPDSIPVTTRENKVVGLERGTLSLVSTTEELLDRKVAAPV